MALLAYLQLVTIALCYWTILYLDVKHSKKIRILTLGIIANKHMLKSDPSWRSLQVQSYLKNVSKTVYTCKTLGKPKSLQSLQAHTWYRLSWTAKEEFCCYRYMGIVMLTRAWVILGKKKYCSMPMIVHSGMTYSGLLVHLLHRILSHPLW